MENYETFIEYLEGRLLYADEQKLFSEMNLDEGLRDQFRRFVSLDKTMKKTSFMNIPPQHLTNSVFAGLGFSFPEKIGVVHTTPSAVPVTSAKTFFRSGTWRLIYTGIGAAIAGVIATLIFIGNDNTNIQSQRYPVIANQNTSKIDNDTKADNNNKNVLIITEKQNIINKKHLINKSVYSPASNNTLEEKTPNSENLLTDLSNSEIFYKDSENLNKLILDNQSGMNNIFVPEIEIPLVLSDKHLSRFSFEIKNSINWNLPKETIYPKEFSKLNNMSVSLLYDLSDKFSIGAELRQETFFVRYEGIEDNSLYSYEQQPNLISYNILLRYRFKDMKILTPFFEISSGINNAGYILRPALGFEYILNNRFIVYLEGEYNYFLFSHQGINFNTSKISLNYGLGFKL